MQKNISLAFLAIMMLVACGDKTSKTGVDADSLITESATIKPTIATVNLDSVRHTKEYITQRIDTIYKYKDDAVCCSNRYNELTNQACKIADELEDLYIECDHWVVGQDIDPNWSYKISNINIESDSIAWAEMSIHNFSDHKVRLKLLYERGDWFVDDILTTYVENGVAKEFSEQEHARNYISENKK
jgi:hypothetical protein